MSFALQQAEPLSPIGAASAEEVLEDRIVRVWTEGLTGKELGLVVDEFLTCHEFDGADVAPLGCPSQDRYRDPRKRVNVEHLNLSVGDAYAIRRTLGYGGFATVRQGRHNASEQDACVKIVEKERAGQTYSISVVESGGYEMLLEMSKNPHRNVVRYLDMFESATRYYVVMEKLQGCELTVALSEKGGKWSQKNCAGVMCDLLSALHHLHEVVGVYHRDVKLENLMFRGRTSGPFAGRKVGGGVVLLDFGLSRFIGQPHDGRYAGTSIYRAPEVSAMNEDGGFSPAVDLWAAGIVLFVLLTGDLPFEPEDVEQKQAAAKAAAAIADFEREKALEGKAVPQALLLGLLEPDPQMRWNAARALQDEWLEQAPDSPAAKSYCVALKKSSESTLVDDKVQTPSWTTPTKGLDETTPGNGYAQRAIVAF
jgi:serine/threonine protein kinase